MKVLTGSDSITARFLYKEHFTFTPTAKFWLAFNHKPRVSDDSHGFWRRVRLIPFLHKFEAGAQDKELMGKLRAEAPGILAWAVQGCLKWQQEGLGMPEVVKAATESYREEMDIIGQFLEERCVVDPRASVGAAHAVGGVRVLGGARTASRPIAGSSRRGWPRAGSRSASPGTGGSGHGSG